MVMHFSGTICNIINHENIKLNELPIVFYTNRLLRDQIIPRLQTAARNPFFMIMVFIMDGAPYHGTL
jgi:hypothetical protein